MFNDPNEVLRQAIAGQASAGQEIVSFVTFDLTAEQPPSPKDPNAAPPPKGAKPQPAKTLIGGGTSNIGFLQGTDDAKDILAANSGNSHAFKMTVRYWIETVAATLTIKPKSSDPSDPQEFRMVSPRSSCLLLKLPRSMRPSRRKSPGRRSSTRRTSRSISVKGVGRISVWRLWVTRPGPRSYDGAKVSRWERAWVYDM
jgi:hypothetical protein